MISITQERLKQLEAENEVLSDLLCRIVEHHRLGHMTIKGEMFGTWQRMVQQAATKDNQGIPYR